MASIPKKSARPSISVVPESGVEEIVDAMAEPAAEIQDSVRSAVETGVSESRAAFTRAKSSAEDATKAFELSWTAAKDGAVSMNAKALEALRVNTEANLEFIKAAFSVKTLSELAALQRDFARKQVDAMSLQVKDLSALAHKTMIESIEPVKEQVAKSFKIAV
jgi:hypothetical protein